ncbi:hypothetical protein [Kurthia sp. Dielmo]|uniref:hypothetical protein n=1 Tax=Kurthia sp. Dielmo TaxID=1033738 RepID=UPI0011214375|nr:hypothetical protein [Kurthia sp. Dielmo]
MESALFNKMRGVHYSELADASKPSPPITEVITKFEDPIVISDVEPAHEEVGSIWVQLDKRQEIYYGDEAPQSGVAPVIWVQTDEPVLQGKVKSSFTVSRKEKVQPFTGDVWVEAGESYRATSVSVVEDKDDERVEHGTLLIKP